MRILFNETYVFVGGGTLGHISPALSLIKLIKEQKKHIKVIFIMTTKEKKYEFLQNNKDIDGILYYDVSGLYRKKIFKNISNVFKIIQTSRKIRKVLINNQVTKVIGMGGYISAIAINIASKLKIKTIIHEQNAVIGLGNKMILSKVDLALSAFPLKEEKFRVVGNPRMQEASSYRKNIVTNNHIVITSGTLGSKIINEEAAKFLMTKKAKEYYTTLITGKKYYEQVISVLGTNQTNYFIVKPFEEHLLEVLSNANLVITRSGATSIFEIIGLGIPAILIPSTNVTNNHQYYNALFIKEKDAGFLLQEEDLNLNTLLKTIEENINNSIYQDNLNKIFKSFENISWGELIIG